VEPAASRFAVLTTVAVLLLALAAPAVAAPGPDPSPGGGGGPQPDPSGGRQRATVTVQKVVPRVITPVTPAAPAPARARAKPHRKHVVHHHAVPLIPRSAPSAVFNSLRSAAHVPARADTARGIDARSLELAAGALLLVVAVGGSFLTLVSQMPRTR
jgi:hypothetical protein